MVTPYYFGGPRLIAYYILNYYVMLCKKLPTGLKNSRQTYSESWGLRLF